MNLTKEVTKAIINQSDKTATSVKVYDFNESDNAIFCNLIDSGGGTIAARRVFSFEEFPCNPLTAGEKEFIKNKTPNDVWEMELIKLWLDSKEIEYRDNDTKEQLLELINDQTQ